MGEVLPLPHRGDVFLDPRGEGRSLRVSGHRGAATVVLSIWRQGECRATFRLSGSEIDEFVGALLTAAPPSAPGIELPAVAGEATAPSVLQVQISGNVLSRRTGPVAVPDVNSEPEDSADSTEGPAPAPDGTAAPSDDPPGNRTGPDGAD